MTKLMGYGLIGVLIVAICLGRYNSVLSDRLDKASKANEDLVADVKSLDETIVALKESIDSDRRTTEEQLRIEQQKREKAVAENRTLREALEYSNCGKQRLPDSALRILRRKG